MAQTTPPGISPAIDIRRVVKNNHRKLLALFQVYFGPPIDSRQTIVEQILHAQAGRTLIVTTPANTSLDCNACRSSWNASIRYSSLYRHGMSDRMVRRWPKISVRATVSAASQCRKPKNHRR